jgi:hypothetical protein
VRTEEEAAAYVQSPNFLLDGIIGHVLSPGTFSMAIRGLQMAVRPTPPEIKTAARFFKADWRAVCVLVGWAQTPEGEWLDWRVPGFDWSQVHPECNIVRARSPAGPHKDCWNQELAAFTIARMFEP